ncbi:transcription initiation factor TFIID subunit 1 isoform X2 [Clupea harengus]|uniref:Transcription initiation factor TFIID subunit 1 isoform X2 n=1 Tax=Clupea harengus TaxID=7950 RepID=A0A6P8H613_CLUHA|nr:transcription initiation factor TFIID subunit 1 isoform X2 [Clupea harengus]
MERHLTGSHQRGPIDSRVHRREHHHDHSFHGYHHIDNQKAADPHTLSRSSSSSTLSTSSSSSSSWSSEPSLDNEAYLMNKPQHSLSCSNIAEPRRKSRDWDSEDVEYKLRSATPFQQRSPHHQSHNQHSHPHSQSQHSRQHPHGSEHGPRFSKLHRGQSKSEEGLLQGIDSDGEQDGWDRHPHMEHGNLYKTASLGRSLAFSDDAKVGARVPPKKAVSTIQLPSKGILKNKDGGSAARQQANFRKAKSMEVLSHREQAAKPGGVGTLATPKPNDPQAMKNNFVKTKLQFSAFLDEITRQVISPSSLNILGVAPGSSPASPRSPHQERKEPPGGVKKEEDEGTQQPKQHSAKTVNQSPAKSGAVSQPQSHSRRDSYPGKQHPNPGSPTRSAGHHQHGSHKKRYSIGEVQGAAGDKQHQGRYNQMATDGTSTSSETILQESKHHRSKQHGNGRRSSSHSQSQHPHGDHRGSPPPPGHILGPDYESPSSKSSTASQSSGHGDMHTHPDHRNHGDMHTHPDHRNHGDMHTHPDHRRHSKSHRDSVSSVNRVQLLEQYNKELHENLLQTVACIENMETELQCSRSELGAFKEKYKRLQESYANLQHSSSALELKLESATENMNSERKYLLQRILEQTKRLDTAENTISSLENINVPALIKELLQKHFKSEEGVRNFLLSTTMKDGKDNQSVLATVEVASTDWPQSGQGSAESGPVRMTAFMPWQQGQNEWSGEEARACVTRRDMEAAGSISQLPFTVADISMALFKNVADAQAKGHEHQHPTAVHPEFHSLGLSTQKPMEVPPNPYEGMGTGRGMGAGGSAGGGEPGDDFTSLTAQRILDNFMRQMPPSSTTEDQEERDSGAVDWGGQPTGQH